MNCHKCGADWGAVNNSNAEHPDHVPFIPTEYGADFVRSEDGGVFTCKSCGARRVGIIIGGNVLKLFPAD